jgi:hypothetical protein
VSGTRTALRDEQGDLLGFAKIMRSQTDQKSQVETREGRITQFQHAEQRKNRITGCNGRSTSVPIAVCVFCRPRPALPSQHDRSGAGWKQEEPPLKRGPPTAATQKSIVFARKQAEHLLGVRGTLRAANQDYLLDAFQRRSLAISERFGIVAPTRFPTAPVPPPRRFVVIWAQDAKVGRWWRLRGIHEVRDCLDRISS